MTIDSGAGRRIDTHHHVVPHFYRDWLEGKGISAGGKSIPTWTADSALDFMASTGVETAILSVSTPGAAPGISEDGTARTAEGRSMARAVNEYCAGLVSDHPQNFGFFATLTLPDVDGALAEATYALDELNADGVVLMTNAHGIYLGDTRFEPLMAELDRRGTTVFVHPSQLPAEPLPHIAPYVADFLLDTTRAAANLVRSGTMDRFRDMKVILSHAGGFVPFAAARMAANIVEDGHREHGLDALRRFYFDTALSSSEYSLPSLLAFADPDRILYGSDFPYAAPDRSRWFTQELDAYPLDDPWRVNRGNAERLFTRLASNEDTSPEASAIAQRSFPTFGAAGS